MHPLYEKLMDEISKFGGNIEVAPKNNYVSLRRKKQFSILQPSTKTRFEIGLNLRGHEPKGRLEAITSPNAMCSHRINISEAKDIDDEVLNWLKAAYDSAG